MMSTCQPENRFANILLEQRCWSQMLSSVWGCSVPRWSYNGRIGNFPRSLGAKSQRALSSEAILSTFSPGLWLPFHFSMYPSTFRTMLWSEMVGTRALSQIAFTSVDTSLASEALVAVGACILRPWYRCSTVFTEGSWFPGILSNEGPTSMSQSWAFCPVRFKGPLSPLRPLTAVFGWKGIATFIISLYHYLEANNSLISINLK